MPNPSAIAKIRSALAKTFHDIGNKNGSALPEGPDNIDPLLHEFYVAAELKSIAGKRYEKAKDALLNDDDTGLGIESASLKVTEGSSGVLQTSDLYSLSLKIARGADHVDPDDLVVSLRRQGVDAEIIKKAVKAATKKRNGAKTYTVSPNL